MAHLIKEKKKLIARLRRIKGQADSVEKALDSGASCVDVLQQIAAIKGAVNGLMKHLLEEHIREHLGSESTSKKERAEDIEEVLKVLKSYLK